MDWKMKRLLQKVHRNCMTVPYLSLAAAATHQWCSPATNWSLRIRTVLAGSALASIKFDSEADEIASCRNSCPCVGQ